MELVPSICLSSLAGAIFFFTGGRLSARGAAAAPDLESERRERAEDEARVARVEAERAIAEARAAREDAELRMSAAITMFGEERARQQAHAEALAAEIAERDRRAAATAGEIAEARAAAAILEQRAASLDRELAKARADVRQALDAHKRLATRVAEAESRAARATDAEARAAEVERLRAENAALKATHAALVRERAASPDPAELQKRSVELTIKARALTQRAEALDRRDAENAELRAKIDELTARAADADELRRRVSELSAMSFARRLEEPAPPSRPPPEGASLATILERELGRLVDREEGCRMAVLADPRGLLIAASPNASYPHEVAAASSLTIHASDRLRELLPLSTPASLELYDDNGLCVRTRWLYLDDECFLVSTVGVVDTDDPEATLLRARLGELIGSGSGGGS